MGMHDVRLSMWTCVYPQIRTCPLYLRSLKQRRHSHYAWIWACPHTPRAQIKLIENRDDVTLRRAYSCMSPPLHNQFEKPVTAFSGAIHSGSSKLIRFQAGCHRRQLNPALVFRVYCVLLYIYFDW